MATRILIVEDEPGLARLLAHNLQFEGYEVRVAAEGTAALHLADTFEPNLVILDLMLPGVDGFEVCRRLAARSLPIPVIILSARSLDQDKIRGLELGADDYVTKPFSLAELLARVRVVLRRFEGRSVPGGTMRVGNVDVDFDNCVIRRGGAAVPATQKELDLLRFFAGCAGRAVTRDEMLRAVWGYRDAPLTRTVDIFVARLRQKVEEDPQNPRHIRTVYGTGYRFTP
jgi:DNA-binding response OmpR family regulator